MPLKRSKKLPKRLARPIDKKTRTLAKKKYDAPKRRKREKMRRTFRRMQGVSKQWKDTVVRWCMYCVIALVCLAVGMMLFSPILKLSAFTIYRVNPRLDIEHVQKVLSPLFGRHLVFVTSTDVEDLLSEHIADIAKVEVVKDYPSTLAVRIELDPLIAKLYIREPDEKEFRTGTGTVTDFITDKGVYVHVVTPGAESLPHVNVVDWGVRPVAGDVLIDPEILRRLNAAENALRIQFGHEIESRKIFIRAREFHVTAGGIEYWFDMSSTLDHQLQRYRTFLQSVELQDVDHYIDLRLADRVIFR